MAARLVEYSVILVSLTLTQGKGGSATDIVLSCPSSFTHGLVSAITCTVNTTRISSAGCYFNPTRFDFKFMFPGTSFFMCSPAPPYPATSCAPATTAGACFCANQSGEFLTYQYNFVADPSYQGGSFACSICEAAASPPNPENDPNCTNIQVVTTTSTTTTTTSTTTTDIRN